MSTSTGSSNTMSDIETIFKDAIEAFKKDIPSEFPQDYQWASFKDVQKEAARIQETQKNSRVMQNLNRIQPFLDAMNRYGVVVDVLAQSHVYMLFIWGPVKCLLKFASGHVPALNELLDCLERIGKGFPLFDKFEPLLKTEPRLGSFISKIFKDILELLATAMVVFRKHVIHQIIQTRWPTFREKIKQCIQQWDYDTKELQAAVFAEHVGQSAIYNAQSEKRERYLVIDVFAQKRKLNGFERKRQESIEIRKKDPNSGNWLLGHKRVRLWRSRMDDTTCVIGLTGIPGAGKSTLSAILLNEVLTATRTSINTLVCANFFTYHENPSNTYFGFLSSILHRILLRDGSLVDYVFDRCPALLNDIESPTEDLEQLLDDMLSNFTTFFILDGVDELLITERKKIIDFSINRSRTHWHSTKVWISSRPEHDIIQQLEAADQNRAVLIRIRKEDNVEDIRYYTMHPSNLPDTDVQIVMLEKLKFQYQSRQSSLDIQDITVSALLRLHLRLRSSPAMQDTVSGHTRLISG
ncbi:hypothetical protein BDD12DRAFT_890828 [Trichophaea hybrida]|nr:hypothetical protein BDD12DRAFT_890828 [Trichophaea hybrida]